MSEHLSFTTLGGDILSIVVNQLYLESPTSLHELSVVSRFCQELVEPWLYRSIELSDADNNTDRTKRLVDRLLDPEDRLSRHVRDLRITDLDGESEELDETDLERIIGGLFRLQAFSWDTNTSIPERVISMLEQRWPNVELKVNNYNRADLDMRLLSSPLLRSLSFCVMNHTATITSTNQLEQYSIFPELREILVKNSSLKELDIRFVYNWMPSRLNLSGMSPRPLNLPLEPSDRLPTLQKLCFTGPPETYEFDLEQCQLLSQCMDWTQLRRLDLGISCPEYFFEEIGRRLPSLKSLTMGVGTGTRWYTHWTQGPLTCKHLGQVTNFIESLPALHKMYIIDLDAAAQTVAPAILTSQKSLYSLSYLTSMHRRHGRRNSVRVWTKAQLLELYQQNCCLSHLELDFALKKGIWPDDYAETLSRFNRLKYLRVIVELDGDASDFAAEYRQNTWGGVSTPKLDEKLGREVTTNLFKSFFKNSPYAQLTDLEVCFTRIEVYDRGQNSDIKFPIRIRRWERDDAPSPLDGGFTIECEGKWLDGW